MTSRMLAALVSLGLACNDLGSSFVCKAAADCQDGDRAGRCEPVGACSFADVECPMGWRYGEYAAGDLGGTCVPTPVVISFTLIDTNSQSPIAGFDPIQSGAVLDLDPLPHLLNIRANTDPELIGSVEFLLDGVDRRVENRSPYAFAGLEANGDYSEWLPDPGVHHLSATPYVEAFAAGVAGAGAELDFEVILQ